MSLLLKLLISTILFPYSFGLLWLFSMDSSGLTGALQDASGALFFSSGFIALVTLWLMIWVRYFTYNWLSVIALLLSLLLLGGFVLTGLPDSLALAAMAIPLMLISCVYTYGVVKAQRVLKNIPR